MIFTAKTDPHARYTVQLSEINRMIKDDIHGFVRQTGEYYKTQVKTAAESIERSKQHIVLLSGPSGSGKTTTADKLKTELAALGKAAHVISLDDFFKGKGNYPKLPDGRDNFESVHALELELIQSTISDMLDRGYAKLPRFDFSTSLRTDNAYELLLSDSDIVIFEGIHALNPILLPQEHGSDAYRIYISPKCRVCDGETELISGKELRLTRRMIRDNKFRNYLHQQTVAIWDNVLNGERENISPFAPLADSVIDTTHFYEYGLYGAHLQKVKSKEGFEKEEKTVSELKERFERFIPVSENDIPSDAMIREFIG